MPKPLTDTQQRIFFGVIVTVLVAFGIYLSVGGFPGGGEDPPAGGSQGGGPETGSETGDRPATAAPSPLETSDAEDLRLGDWLPFEEEEFVAAAVTAREFAAAYGTYDHSESDTEYYERLTGLATEEFAETLRQRSGASALRSELAEEETAATGRAEVTAIRGFDEDSVVFVVRAQSIAESTDAIDEDLGEFAVTTVPRGDSWRVFDFQPADAGNLGGEG